MILTLAVVVGVLLGGVVASYATTWALRATDDGAPSGPRSRCDGCQHPLTWSQTLPVVSYVVARGRCAHCAAAISPYHPIGEALGMVLGAMIALAAPDGRALPLAVIAASLLAASVYDARTWALPRATTGLAAGAAFALAAWHGRDSLIVGLIAAAATFAVTKTLAVLYQRRNGRVGFGDGDVLLLSALAIWLGAATPWMVLVACGLGLIFALVGRRRRFPFGPMIALSGVSIGLLLEAGIWPRP
ncbi:A24 family peptidase [Caulobacter sp. SSI4214]|uniref:prepilin peptidase n=1 Tax=Caulobacter sp. SSI4214 TaxID=2575739 RepID=UPI00143C73C5|nr:A24 family peptidase [Caulobacter sp. SSI4214]